MRKILQVFLLFSARLIFAQKPRADPKPDNDSGKQELHFPTVHIGFMASNKANWLPFSLSCLDRLVYPKDRISIEFFTDNNQDNTKELLEEWAFRPETVAKYAHLEVTHNTTLDMGKRLTWDDESRHSIVLWNRQKGLESARRAWADFYMYIDADIFLTDVNTLNDLLDDRDKRDWVVKSPFLRAATPSSFANFWGAQNPHTGYYQRSDDYTSLLERETPGIWPVPVVHSCVLIDLRKKKSDGIQFHPAMPDYKFFSDEVIIMSYNFKMAGVTPYIDNRKQYGTIGYPIDEQTTPDYIQFVHTMSEVMIEPPVGVDLDIPPVLPTNNIYPKKLENFGFDVIYCINLLRRPDRRNRMERLFEMHGIGPVVFPGAVDGHKITQEWLDSNGVKPLQGFVDPFHGRTLTKGEIGCFLSHWRLWLHVVKHKYQRILILEDDLRFEIDFMRRFHQVIDDMNQADKTWDLMYLGRKKMQIEEAEIIPDGSSGHVTIADYSYWTLAYALSYTGAEKLIKQAPLDRLVPVDEYLPIMFNKHDREDLMQHFEPRDLKAYSAEPLLLYPTHYVGQQNYFSDTELSGLWEEAKTDAVKEAEKQEAASKAKLKEAIGNEVFKRLAIDERFKYDRVIADYAKWEGDMQYLCDNLKANPNDNWQLTLPDSERNDLGAIPDNQVHTEL